MRSGRHGPTLVGVIAVLTAGVVVLAGGGDAFWLCVPAALLASAASATRLGAALSTAVVIAAAATPAEALMRPLPSAPLALLVPIASVAVLVAIREGFERERAALRDLALGDPLTGIANRRSLLLRAGYEIARHTRVRRTFALVMIDLDGFKRLNDRFGHAAGDDLLRDVAAALKDSMRAQDTVARLGGDEFCVLAPETGESGTLRLATRVAQAVGSVTAGVEAVRASAGIAVFPEDGVTTSALLEIADQRLLDAKRERRRGRAQRRAA
jgi:diguanylate cyclase (GGDEF)-like protein